jgi:hypothetical protein
MPQIIAIINRSKKNQIQYDFVIDLHDSFALIDILIIF